MAVRLEGSIQRWLGLSTDAKPTGDVSAGSSFMETDTGRIYRYDGTAWTVPGEGIDTQGEWLALIYAELVQLREVVELATN